MAGIKAAIKPSKDKLTKAIYNAMEGKGTFKATFKYKLKTASVNGTRMVFRQQECLELVPAKRDELIAAVTNFCEEMSEVDPRYFVKKKEAEEIIESWKYRGDAIEVKNPILFKDQLGYCFRRVPFYPEPGATPTWDSVISRMTNADAFKMFIASMFHTNSYMQQYIWIYGEGGEGKGSIGRWLQKVFGPTYFSLSSIPKSQFWKASLVGKRCVVFSDWSSSYFVTGGEFKTMVGGDPQSIEEKYERPYNMILSCKYIFFSNERPAVASEASDMRRLIYCHIDPIDESKKEYDAFEAKLWDESAAFIHSCLALYRENCPNHEPIPFDHGQSKNLAAENESEYEGLLQGSFKEGGYVTSAEMVDWYRRRGLQRQEKIEWKKFLQRRGIKYGSVKRSGKVFDAFKGISFRDDYSTVDAESLLEQR
jgi:hypothetical protein